MNLSTETISDTRAKVTVTVSGDEVAAEERSALRELTRQVRIPGFRPGKAPEAMIRRRHAKDLADELQRRVISKAYKQATEDSGLKIFTLVELPRLEIMTFEPGTDLELPFTFDLQPQFELPEYKNIETRLQPAVVADEDVEKEIENIRRQRADFNTVEREAQAGDYVKVTYKGEVDGQEIKELAADKPIWGTQENTWEEAGSSDEEVMGVPAIVSGVIGMKAGDSKSVTQEFGEDHEVEALRGKTGTYSVEVHEVRERVMPELDDEFAKSLKLESVEELRNRIRSELQRRKDNERRMNQRNQIAAYLEQNTQFAIPESAIESETDKVMQRVMHDNVQRGVPEEEFEKHKEQFYAQSREIAARQVKRDFMLFEVAKRENIKLTNEDLTRAIMAQAQRYRVTPDELAKELGSNEDARRGFQQSVLVDKVLEFLADEATVIEETAPAPTEQPAS